MPDIDDDKIDPIFSDLGIDFESYPQIPNGTVPKIFEDVTMPKEDGGGQRHDKGKIRMDLIPPEWEYALADVLTQGAEKYAERNWERGMDWSKPIGCARRHIAKFMMGERYDWETGCHHLAMAAWNLLALMTYDLRGIENIRNLPHAPELMEPANSGIDVLMRVNRDE